MEFLAYSDIHHDDYTNGITLEDVVAVEHEITRYAIDNNIFDVFFLGDWYRATNPIVKVRAVAEAAWKYRSDAAIQTTVLVGNHDRQTKSAVSQHAFVAVDIFKEDLKNVRVMDEVCTIRINNIEILMIPSGHEYAALNPGEFGTDIIMFHGLLAGSALANGGSASSGINPGTLSKLGANLIIGGDNHTPQMLDSVLGCPSFYCGAPMQHNWGDRGQKRGFWHVKWNDNTLPARWEYKLIQTMSPRFVRRNFVAKSEMETLMEITNDLTMELDGRPGIVEITLIGNRATEINKEFIEQNVLQMGARRVSIIIDRSIDKVEVAAGIGAAQTEEEKWNLYLTKGKAPGIDKMNPMFLSELGKWAIQEAKRRM